MSTSNYSYFNTNNSNSVFRSLSSYVYDTKMLPMYSVYNTQLITYFFIGVTTITLGYITLSEKSETSGSTTNTIKPPSIVPAIGGSKNVTKHAHTISKKHKKTQRK